MLKVVLSREWPTQVGRNGEVSEDIQLYDSRAVVGYAKSKAFFFIFLYKTEMGSWLNGCGRSHGWKGLVTRDV